MLERSRALGFLGPGPVEAQLDHARALVVIAVRAASGPTVWAQPVEVPPADVPPAGDTPAEAPDAGDETPGYEAQPEDYLPPGEWSDSDEWTLEDWEAEEAEVAEMALQYEREVQQKKLEAARTYPLATSAGPWLDLGSGGGLPGLVVACELPDQPLVLLDANERRCAFLRDACDELGRPDVQVVHGRAEDVADLPEHRGAYGLVLARSFGAPAVTAECAVAFLQVGGLLVVSDRVEGDADRWPAEGLDRLGFGPTEHVVEQTAAAAVMRRERVVEGFPRRNGVPSKRPLW